MNVYELSNRELIQAFNAKNKEQILEISSKSIFLIPVQNKDRVDKIAFESMMDSQKHYYIPIFINMADVDANPMIKGKQILIAHFGMIEQILNAHPNLYGICINPCTMDLKLDRTESYKICELFHQNEDKITFEDMPSMSNSNLNVGDFYKKETFTMADLKPKLNPRSEIIIAVVEYLKTTTIKKAYLSVKMEQNKLHYKFFIDYNQKENSYIDELNFKLNDLIQEDESYEIVSTKSKLNAKIILKMKPIYKK